jgi:hypothetical protein
MAAYLTARYFGEGIHIERHSWSRGTGFLAKWRIRCMIDWFREIRQMAA